MGELLPTEDKSLRARLHRLAEAIQTQNALRAMQLRHVAEEVGSLEREHAKLMEVAGDALRELHSVVTS